MPKFVHRFRIVGHSAIYLGSSATGKLIAFLLLPIVTAYLSPADYGKWSTYQALLSAMACLVGLNLQTNITRSYFRVDRGELSKLLAHLFMTLGGSTLVVSSLCYPFWVSETPAAIELDWLVALPLVAAIQTVSSLNLTLLRLEQKPWAFASLEVGSGLIYAAMLYALLTLGWGWTSQVISLWTSSLIFAAVSAVQLAMGHRLWHPPDTRCFRSILAISLPQVPNMLAGFALALGDRLLIQYYLGLEAVGVYGIAYNLGLVMQTFCDSVFKAWNPVMYRSLAEADLQLPSVVRQIRWVMLGLLVVAAAFVAILKPLATWILPESYRPALNIVWIVVASYWVRALYQIGHALLIHVGNTRPLIRANILAAIANVALNVWLLPDYGIEAAAWNTLAGYAIAAAITLSYQQRQFPLPWRELFG